MKVLAMFSNSMIYHKDFRWKSTLIQLVYIIFLINFFFFFEETNLFILYYAARLIIYTYTVVIFGTSVFYFKDTVNINCDIKNTSIYLNYFYYVNGGFFFWMILGVENTRKILWWRLRRIGVEENIWLNRIG